MKQKLFSAQSAAWLIAGVVAISGIAPGTHAAPAAPAQIAQAAKPTGLSAADQKIVGVVEKYLNSIKSMQADFVQTSSQGATATGKLYLQRSRQLRIDYAPPANLQIYANGFWLIYVDTELKEITHVPLSATPASVLIRDRTELSGSVDVVRVSRDAGIIDVHMVDADEPESGQVVLSFMEKPLRIRNWKVIDPTGIETTVDLIKPVFNRKIPNDTFNFDDTGYDSPNNE